MTVLYLSVVVWFATTIVVEAEITRPVREKAERWPRLGYLLHCHMCCGTWVGFLVAAATPYRPIQCRLPLGAWLLAALLYKGVAHLLLALNHLIVRINNHPEA